MSIGCTIYLNSCNSSLTSLIKILTPILVIVVYPAYLKLMGRFSFKRLFSLYVDLFRVCFNSDDHLRYKKPLDFISSGFCRS